MRKSIRVLAAIAAVFIGSCFFSCSGGGHTHSFGRWEEVAPASCTAAGEQKRVCECGVIQYAEIPKSEHTPGEWAENPATCTENGSRTRSCTVCETPLESETLNKLGHNFEAGVCLRCGGVDPDYVVPHTHSYSSEVTDPTCTNAGFTTHVCECGDTYNDSEVVALGHDYFTDWTIDVLPTAQTAGSKSHHCARCDDKSDITSIAAGTTIHAVMFLDYDGTLIATEYAENGNAVVAPTAPVRNGYRFEKWDGDFSSVSVDTTVIAKYIKNTVYTVTFVDYDNTVLASVSVESGASAQAPALPSHAGYTFLEWDKSFDDVESDMTVRALYDIKEYNVTFKKRDGSVIATQKVKHGAGAEAPNIDEQYVEWSDGGNAHTAYRFVKWDKAFDGITCDLTVTAVYEKITAPVIALRNKGTESENGGKVETIEVWLLNNPTVTGVSLTVIYDSGRKGVDDQVVQREALEQSSDLSNNQMEAYKRETAEMDVDTVIQIYERGVNLSWAGDGLKGANVQLLVLKFTVGVNAELDDKPIYLLEDSISLIKSDLKQADITVIQEA